MRISRTSLRANNLDQAEDYKHIPDVIEILAKRSWFHAKYNKVSFARVGGDSSGSQVKFLGRNCPERRNQVSNDALAYCFEDKMQSVGYKIDFTDVGVVAILVIS